MLKALLLIFDPVATWDGIARARRGLPFVLMVYLVPLLTLSCVGEAYGLINWGKWQFMGRLKRFSVGEAAIYEAAQFVLSLGIVFIGAKLVKALGETFHGRHTFEQTFRTVAYGLSPVFLLRLLDAFTVVSPWVSWSIGILLTTAVLYHGVPRIMEPDPPQAFGLYLMSALLLFLITGLSRFVTAWYLQGKFTRLEPFISGLGARLPF